MKKFLLILSILILIINPVYAEDDDSTPYMPYFEQPKQETQPKTDNTKKKTPVKKKTTKKKSTVKKATKKTAAKKVSAPRQSSLQKAIELLNQDRYEESKKFLLRAIQENKNDPNVWYWYGVWHEKNGGFYQAQYFYSKAVKIDPAFDPLSRVVYYPNDSEKTPLWDPKRPARVYPVETTSRGVTTVSPAARDRKNFPSAPNDPELPKVPVYTPPEPGTNPLDGDPYAPGIYVPPSRNEVQTAGELSPYYVPPSPERVVAENVVYEPEELERDKVIRADVPLYNPPEPGQKIVAQAPKVQTETKTQVRAKESKKTIQAEPKRQNVAVRVIKQSDRKKNQEKKEKTQVKVKEAEKKQEKKQTEVKTEKTDKKEKEKKEKTEKVEKVEKVEQTKQKTETKTETQPQKQTRRQSRRNQQNVSQDVKPKPKPKEPEKIEKTQPKIILEERPPKTTEKPETPEKPDENPQRQNEYLPPVGQYPSDPGTIPEIYIPPVGQGEN
ncbi:MAG: tetratricopeptide repeat protein [Synergistaceae bacterium]|nr:tetratricopeptide repeat protein [Synergistaceae bacterium]